MLSYLPLLNPLSFVITQYNLLSFILYSLMLIIELNQHQYISFLKSFLEQILHSSKRQKFISFNCDYMYQKMLQIAKKNDAMAMAEFMVAMAMETENKTLDTKIVTKAVEYLIESDYGQTIVKKIDGEPVAAMFLTYQNDQIWWISSVFVTKPYRGKGIFSQLFYFAQSLAVSKGIRHLRLYAQQANTKAKQTYLHMGMHLTSDRFYGYDLTCEQILFLDNPLLKVKRLEVEPDVEGMINICDRDFGKNKGLGCYLKGHLEGYCEYFLEFSEWRFGLTVYISSLFIRKGEIGKEVLTQFFQYLRRYQDLNVSTLRIITKDDNEQLLSIAPKITKLSYDVLQIKLNPRLAKL